MKACPRRCAVLVDSTDRFCYACGAELVARPQCSCGRPLSPSVDRYCPSCGKKAEGFVEARR